MTLLELANYSIGSYHLNPMKYSLIITGILIISNFLESKLFSLYSFRYPNNREF